MATKTARKPPRRSATRAAAERNAAVDPDVIAARLRRLVETDKEREIMDLAGALAALVAMKPLQEEYALQVTAARAAARDEVEEERRRRELLEDRLDGLVLWRPRLDDRRKRQSPTIPDRMRIALGRRRYDALERVLIQSERIETSHEVLDQSVAEARRVGVSWADIGAVTGRGAEGARTRWGRDR